MIPHNNCKYEHSPQSINNHSVTPGVSHLHEKQFYPVFVLLFPLAGRVLGVVVVVFNCGKIQNIKLAF